MSKINVQIDETWKDILSEEFQSDYFHLLKQFLVKEKETQTVYPPSPLIFSAFNKTPFDKVKVVILGQDPYHGVGQAHGLCFSVPEGIPIPPSLINIFKELSKDINIDIPQNGNLEKWANEGVLLLNATLTVRAHQAGSHQKKGWEQFTDAVISQISEKKENIVFILWGNYAQSKIKLIDQNKHFVIKSVHPSPLSANRGGFFGTKPFSKANTYLKSKNIKPVNWNL
jgi:uracil-DNA glycosylase